PGIDPTIEQSVCELFFTTKEQGTGIGLSVAKIVAQSHGGWFRLSNRPDGGACACLSIPIIEDAILQNIIKPPGAGSWEPAGYEE
ncbi:MAG: ATP-binding protein, partial [Pseudomonadota bacterium]